MNRCRKTCQSLHIDKLPKARSGTNKADRTSLPPLALAFHEQDLAVVIKVAKDMPVEPGRGTVMGRALLEGKVVQIPDVMDDSEYTWTDIQKLGAFRTILGVPLVREGTPT